MVLVRMFKFDLRGQAWSRHAEFPDCPGERGGDDGERQQEQQGEAGHGPGDRVGVEGLHS